MTEEYLTTSHLPVVMTTTEVHITTGGKGLTSSYSFDAEFYFELAVAFMGIVGVAGNTLILYALVASKQHKKHALIVNQNALDLFSSFFVALVYTLRLCNIRLSGNLGYWLCVIVFSEYLIWCGTNGSIINLGTITVERYLKVVHPIWSRKYLRPWVIYCAMSFAWISSSVYNAIMVSITCELRDGECYAYIVLAGGWHDKIYVAWYISSFYCIILIIFIFCYGRILVAIRRQASVMAVHSGPGPSTAQAQSNQIQSNVIKTMILVSDGVKRDRTSETVTKTEIIFWRLRCDQVQILKTDGALHMSEQMMVNRSVRRLWSRNLTERLTIWLDMYRAL